VRKRDQVFQGNRHVALIEVNWFGLDTLESISPPNFLDREHLEIRFVCHLAAVPRALVAQRNQRPFRAVET
jgi:hypothetical protein